MERLFECITQTKIEVGETKENDLMIGKDERPDWTLIGFQVISIFPWKFPDNIPLNFSLGTRSNN